VSRRAWACLSAYGARHSLPRLFDLFNQANSLSFRSHAQSMLLRYQHDMNQCQIRSSCWSPCRRVIGQKQASSPQFVSSDVEKHAEWFALIFSSPPASLCDATSTMSSRLPPPLLLSKAVPRSRLWMQGMIVGRFRLRGQRLRLASPQLSRKVR
jgi:hypothetical protein